MIYAGLYGIQNKLSLPEPANINLYKADARTLTKFRKLPYDLQTACRIASESEFIRTHVPASVLDIYCNK